MPRRKKVVPVPPVPVAPVTSVEPRRKLWQALFFTKDGRLDLGWLLLLISCVVFLGVFIGQALSLIPPDKPGKEAWGVFAILLALAFIGGAARDRAALMSKGTLVGAVTGVISGVRDALTKGDETERGGE